MNELAEYSPRVDFDTRATVEEIKAQIRAGDLDIWCGNFTTIQGARVPGRLAEDTCSEYTKSPSITRVTLIRYPADQFLLTTLSSHPANDRERDMGRWPSELCRRHGQAV